MFATKDIIEIFSAMSVDLETLKRTISLVGKKKIKEK